MLFAMLMWLPMKVLERLFAPVTAMLNSLDAHAARVEQTLRDNRF